MTPSVWIALSSLGVTLLVAGVGFVVWLVRLEGRVNAKADSTAVLQVGSEVSALSGRLDVLEVAAKAHEGTKIEVVRLQEQIKHLTDLIEKLLARPARRRAGE